MKGVLILALQNECFVKSLVSRLNTWIFLGTRVIFRNSCLTFIKRFSFEIPWSPEVFNSPRQILTLLNKVPGYWLQGKTDLANKPRNMQIFPHSKFGIDRTAGLKVMAKKFLRPKLYFLAITFEAAVRLIPNFECGKICMFLGLFAKSVLPWSQ